MWDLTCFRRRHLAVVFSVSLLAGCSKAYFDVGQTLPARKGVSSQLSVTPEGDERASILQNHGVDDRTVRAVVVQQIICNETEHDLQVYRFPPFEAELISVKSDAGGRVPLTPGGREFARKRRDPGRGISKIPAHTTEKIEYILSEWFNLGETGTYTVEIETRYSLIDNPGAGYYETNPDPIAFEVK
jgi:hypothetical protein